MIRRAPPARLFLSTVASRSILSIATLLSLIICIGQSLGLTVTISLFTKLKIALPHSVSVEPIISPNTKLRNAAPTSMLHKKTGK